MVAFERRNAIGDIVPPLERAERAGRGHAFDVFTPFATGNAYLWLGLGAALTVVAVVLPAGRRVLFPWATVAFALVAITLGAYAVVERDSEEAALRSGIYINVADDVEEVEYVAPVFDPFNWRSPYLALGLAGGLLAGAVAAGVSSRREPRSRRLRAPRPRA